MKILKHFNGTSYFSKFLIKKYIIISRANIGISCDGFSGNLLDFPN